MPQILLPQSKVRFYISYFNSALLIAASVLLQGLAAGATTAKKTVCSITINSDQEINAFKKNLSPDLWNFVELTTLNSGSSSSSSGTNQDNKKDWMKNACEAKASCDILLISGHFAGSFFGESGLSLSLEDLEKYSCNSDCAGILKQPKEVFLFGCNTLATKEKDHRSSEEYRQVLIHDGFSAEQANQIVAYRYSAYGPTARSRMAHVFNQTPRIYGFYSVAPGGKNVESSVNNYLLNAKDNYQNFDDMNQKLQTALNTKLIKAMSVFPLVQVEGSDVRSPQKFEKPYCYLASAKVSRLQKLQYIQRVLESGQTLTVIPHIQNYMKEEIELQKSGKDTAWSIEEKNILLGLKANEKIKNDFNQLLSLPGDMYLKLRVDILNLMKSLLQITEGEFNEKIVSILDLNLSQPMTLEKKDLICSLGIESDLVYEQIPKARWKDHLFIKAVGCLKPKNPKIHQTLAEAMLKDADSGVRTAAVLALGEIKLTDPKIHQALVEAMLKDAVWGVRFWAARVLVQIIPTDPKIQQALVEAMLKDANSYVRDEVAKALSEIKPADPKIHQALVEALLKDANSNVRVRATWNLGKIKPSDPKVFQALVKALLEDTDSNVRYYAAEALGKIKPTDPKILQYLIDNKSKAKDPERVQKVIAQLRAR